MFDMIRFLKVVTFFALCLCAKEALAAAEGSAVQTKVLDFGTVVVSSNNADIKVDASSGSVTVRKVTYRGVSRGEVMVTSPIDLAENVLTITFTAASLTCVEDCSSGATKGGVLLISADTSKMAQSADVPTLQYVGGEIQFKPWTSSYTGLWEGDATMMYQYTAGGVTHEIATIPVRARVRVDTQLPPITVSKAQDMSFGTVAKSSTHNVTLNPNGCTISSSVPTALISTAGVQCGIFRIKNETSSAQALAGVTLPSSIALNGSSSGSMTLDLTTYPALNTITSVPASTTISVNVGGTLHVLNTNPVGTYSGNYTLTVDY